MTKMLETVGKVRVFRSGRAARYCPRSRSAPVRGGVPAHPVHAATGRSGRGAEVDALQGVCGQPQPFSHRPEEELREVGSAAVDVAAHEVAVPPPRSRPGS